MPGGNDDGTVGSGTQDGGTLLAEILREVVRLTGGRMAAVAEHLKAVGLFEQEHIAVAAVGTAGDGEPHNALHEVVTLALKDAEEGVLKDVADAGVELLLCLAYTDAIAFGPQGGLSL